MNQPIPMRPQRLLLATDLSARCDRPLDRAKQLALEWQASLHVLMVRDSPGTPEEVAAWLSGSKTVHAFELAARAELAEEFTDTGLSATLQVAQGEVTDAILAAAALAPQALTVIGATRDETFQQVILGSTAVRLAQDMAQPLLVVRQRTRGRYARILVANDFGDAARRALVTSLRLFPGRRITLLHVLEDGAAGAASIDSVAAAQQASLAFLDRCAVDAEARAWIDVVIGHGSVVDAITTHAQARQMQLVVLGVQRYSAVARVFLGSRSDDLLRHLACDTLLVRAEESSADD